MKLKTIICLFLCTILLCASVFFLGACGKGSTEEETTMSEAEEVRKAVESRGYAMFWGTTIGGKEIKSSRASVTNISKKSDTEYLVNGVLYMTDVYGTVYSNTFDCRVTKPATAGGWSAGSFEYDRSAWRSN